jgi:transposase
MRRLGYSYEYISKFLEISQRAVQYTCQKQQATPQHKNAGRPPRLSKEEADRVEEFVIQSKKNRRMTYLQVAEALWPEGEVGAESVRYALHQRGYRRRIALRKPPISESNRVARLEWAREHVNWTKEQWYTILWSDETWVTGTKHRRTFVTCKKGEELNTDCVIERVSRQSGWMFWACFSSYKKGPCLFWEKEWGTISSESYSERVVPLIEGWIRLNPGLRFMQDNAPAHASESTIQEFQERGIQPITWPAYSPDLNPIETVWNEMKDWLARNYPREGYVSYDALRKQVLEAWEAIGEDLLSQLVDTMQQRCQDVIDADGRHTKW